MLAGSQGGGSALRSPHEGAIRNEGEPGAFSNNTGGGALAKDNVALRSPVGQLKSSPAYQHARSPRRVRPMPLSEDIRRVVTTVDKNGKAVVLFDGDNPHKVVRPNRSVTSRLVWVDRPDAGRHVRHRRTARRSVSASRRRRMARSFASSTSRRPRRRSRQLREGPPAQADRRPCAEAGPAAAPPADAPHAHDRLRHHHGRARSTCCSTTPKSTSRPATC